MKVYVDELPANCSKCPFRDETLCSLTHKELRIDSFCYDREKDCPLELIADHDKEKDYKIAVLERALDFVFKNAYEIECENLNGGTHVCSEEEYVAKCKKFVIDQAEKELKGGDIN